VRHFCSPSLADHIELGTHSKNNASTHLGEGREKLIMGQENDPEFVRLVAEAMTEEDMNLMPEGAILNSLESL